MTKQKEKVTKIIGSAPRSAKNSIIVGSTYASVRKEIHALKSNSVSSNRVKKRK